MFAVCALPVFFWAILSYFYAFPGYVLRLTVWDLIGAASYVLAYALLASLIITAPFLLAAIILPARLFKAHAVVLTAIIILVTSVWMMYANYHQVNLANLDYVQSLPSILFYILSVVVPIALVLRIRRLYEIVQAFVTRLTVLIYIYTTLACLGLLIVIVRNL
jgi:hypothetical protein